MSKYKFIKCIIDEKDPYDRTKIVMTVSASSLDDILSELKGFLQACGFTIDGDIVVEEPVSDE